MNQIRERFNYLLLLIRVSVLKIVIVIKQLLNTHKENCHIESYVVFLFFLSFFFLFIIQYRSYRDRNYNINIQ